MAYGTRSEFGKLKRVLMHRPTTGFDRITEETLAEYNFDAVPDLATYLRDYDMLTSAITARGAEVVLLTDVLKGNSEALDYIALRPNIIYTRDLAVVVSDGAILTGMTLRSRQHDPWVLKAAFERLGIPIVGEIAEPGCVEGGGVTFLDETTCVIGLCDRANHRGVKQFCDILFDGGYAEEVVLIPLPAGEVHIDGAFMMVGPNTALIYPPLLSIHPARVLRKGKEPRYALFPDYLDARDTTLIEVTNEERSNAALNIIITEPFHGVGYETGERLFAEMAQFGGDFSSVPSAELLKGSGGPHCKTCPIERD